MLRSLSAVVLLGSLPLAACGGGQELVVPVETMIEFEASWQCDVTRYSFADAEAIEAKEQELRDRFGIGATDQATFVAMVADDAELRSALAAQIDDRCPTTVPTGEDT